MIKKPLILITRPLQDSNDTAKTLQKTGLDTFIEPLLTIKPIKHEINLNDNQTIIATSSNAIRNLNDTPKTTPVITVGDTSAQTAKSLGFTDVISAGGNVNDLTKFIIDNYSSQKDNFIYATGDIITGDLQQQLTQKGFNIEKIITYEAIATGNLTDQCQAKIKAGEFDAILFYSPRTAKIFTDLTTNNDLTNTHAFCISQNAAQALYKLNFKDIHISLHSNGESLLELITNFGFTR